MPSSATITTFYTFVADTKARSSQVNFNFSAFRGHSLPIEPLTATASDVTYDLGSSDHSWRVGYMKSINIRNSTSTASAIIQGNTSVTAGAMELLFGSSTISSWSSSGMLRTSLESASTRMTVTSSQSGNATQAGPTYLDMSSLSMAFTVIKSPVEISIFSGVVAEPGAFIRYEKLTSTAGLDYGHIRVQRITGATTVVVDSSGFYVSEGIWPLSSFRWIDDPGPGTFTYNIQAHSSDTVHRITVSEAKMRIREL